MFDLSLLGTVHTAIGLVAVLAGLAAFVRHREIPPDAPLGRAYVWLTVLTSLTSLGIYHHGGFGKPHVLALLTLAALAFAAAIRRRATLGAATPYVAMVTYSLTFLFHMIPAVTETFTRLPAGAPLFANADDPALQQVFGVFFVLFLVGATAQVLRLRGIRGAASGAPA